MTVNLGPETEYVEHKKSTSEIKEGMQSVGSILNKHGRGTLYFGVLDNGDVIGQQVGKSTLRDISQAVGYDIKPTIHPTIEKLTTEDGKDYVRVEFHGNERPYTCKGIYRTRVADEDVVMSDDELRQIVLYEQARKIPWDQWESDRPIEDVDEDELRAFVERGNACGRIDYPFTTVEDVLSRLKLMKNGKLTNAAEVLFCPSRTTALKMGILATHARTEILDLHQESGTLFELVRKAEHYILVNTRRRFVIEGGGPREEIPELPQEAVREVLFNAYGHRDWISRGCVQIDIYNDAVEITSPRLVHRRPGPCRTSCGNGPLLPVAQHAHRGNAPQIQGHRSLRHRHTAHQERLRGGWGRVRLQAGSHRHLLHLPPRGRFRWFRQSRTASSRKFGKSARKCAKVRERPFRTRGGSGNAVGRYRLHLDGRGRKAERHEPPWSPDAAEPAYREGRRGENWRRPKHSLQVNGIRSSRP